MFAFNRRLCPASRQGPDQNRNSRGAEENKYVAGLKRVMDENPLPAFEEIAHYFPPNGAFVVNDDTGFHFLAYQRRAEEK